MLFTTDFQGCCKLPQREILNLNIQEVLKIVDILKGLKIFNFHAIINLEVSSYIHAPMNFKV